MPAARAWLSFVYLEFCMSIVQHLIHGELVTKGERTADVFNLSLIHI